MAKVIVTYDLDSGWGAVKTELFAGNFYNVLSTTMGNRVAPNTTVFIDNVTPEEAIRQFDAAVARASASTKTTINVEKLFAASLHENWRIRSDRSN